jgi:hypothetical protein
MRQFTFSGNLPMDNILTKVDTASLNLDKALAAVSDGEIETMLRNLVRYANGEAVNNCKPTTRDSIAAMKLFFSLRFPVKLRSVFVAGDLVGHKGDVGSLETPRSELMRARRIGLPPEEDTDDDPADAAAERRRRWAEWREERAAGK